MHDPSSFLCVVFYADPVLCSLPRFLVAYWKRLSGRVDCCFNPLSVDRRLRFRRGCVGRSDPSHLYRDGRSRLLACARRPIGWAGLRRKHSKLCRNLFRKRFTRHYPLRRACRSRRRQSAASQLARDRRRAIGRIPAAGCTLVSDPSPDRRHAFSRPRRLGIFGDPDRVGGRLPPPSLPKKSKCT